MSAIPPQPIASPRGDDRCGDEPASELVFGGPELLDAPEISLVVSTLGRPERLRRLIESVRAEADGGPSIELIVVDQSAEGIARPTLDLDEPGFCWTYARSSIGVSKGRNIGLGLARGGLIMFPDDDSWFPGTTLRRSVAHFERHPDHDGLCTQLQDGEGRLSMLRWAQTAKAVTKANHHRTSIGSTMLFRAEAARSTTGFDEQIGPGSGTWFGSCEDADFLLRVIGTGATVWYDPTVVMHHRDGRRDGGRDADRKSLAYGCGQGHMWRQHRFPLVLITSLLIRRMLGSVVWSLRGRSDIGRAHRAWVRGAINGWFDTPPLNLVQVPAGNTQAPAEDRPNAPSSSEFGRSLSWRIASAPLGTVATFALTAIAARTLRAGEVTVFYGMLAALMIGPILSRFGLSQRSVRELAAARTRDDLQTAADLARRHVVSALAPPLVAAPVISLLFIAGVSRGPIDWQLVGLATVTLIAESWRLTVSDALIGLGMTGWAAALAHQVRAAAVTTVVVIHALLLPGRLDLHRLMLLMAGVAVVSAAVAFRRLWSLPHRDVDVRAPIELGELLRLGLPFLLVDLTVVVVARGDVWLAGAALGEEQAALYSTASLLAVQIGIPIGLASIALAPLVAGYVAQGRLPELERLVRTLSTLVAYLVLPVFIAFALFGDRVLSLAYGETYRLAHHYLVVLMVGNLALATLGASAVILLMANRHLVAMYLSITWLGLAAPFVLLAAFLGGPMSLAVASASTTVGLYGLLSFAVWATSGIRLIPYLDPRRLLMGIRLAEARRQFEPRRAASLVSSASVLEETSSR